MMNRGTDKIILAKKIAGYAAADLIEDGMVIGLGTGSTTAFFLEALSKRCAEGLKIKTVATSNQTTDQARHLNLPLIDPQSIKFVDITVDGADEIDKKKNMIKGGGGALLREKLLAKSSGEMIVIIDETKYVDALGDHPVPLEISVFMYQNTIDRLNKKGYEGILRLDRNQKPFISDNGNYIFDIQYSSLINNPSEEHHHLKLITGVIETGLFFNIAGRVVIGFTDGNFKISS